MHLRNRQETGTDGAAHLSEDQGYGRLLQAELSKPLKGFNQRMAHPGSLPTL